MTTRDRKLLRATIVIFGLAGLLTVVQMLWRFGYPLFLRANDESNAQHQQLVAHFRTLKLKLTPWARTNRNALNRMLHSKQDEFNNNRLIWDICPAFTVSRNNDPSNRVFEGTEIAETDLSGKIPIAWVCGIDRFSAKADRSAVKDDPKFWKDEKRAQIVRENTRQFYWEKYRDVPLWQTSAPGREKIILFASGRIIACREPADLYSRLFKEKPRYRENLCDLREIEPPYTFL